MTEPAVDTQATPPEPTGQAAEPTPQEVPPATPQDGGNGQTGEPPHTPPQLTPEQREQQLEERMFQRVASWQGRRDKALLDSISQIVAARPNPQAQTPPQPAAIDATTLLEKPEAVLNQFLETQAPKVFEKVFHQRTQAEQQFTGDVVRNAAALMDTDPLFTDLAFGNEVVAEIQRNFGNMRRDVSPEVAAQLLVNSAVTNVYRKTKSPANGLSENRPAVGPLGGVKPPPFTPPKAPPVKLSSEAKKLAERFGYKDEDLAKVFAVEA